jgi:hypothetical protein
MEVFETNLTGTDGQVEGLVSTLTQADEDKQYMFSSFDNSLTITIGKDEAGHWKRISSTEPYLSGWVDELGEQIDQRTTSTY